MKKLPNICKNESNLNLPKKYDFNEFKSITRYNYQEIKELPEIDYSFIFKEANYSNLNKSYHVSKLISKLYCHENALNLLIAVTSNISSFHRRNAIRLTWGNINNFNNTEDFRVFFIVGKSHDNNTMNGLLKESNLFQDIILGDYYETFYNLPYKFETIFEWAYKYCDFQYLLKTDDDVFINIPNMLKLLNSDDTPKKNIYRGRAHFFVNVLREGKYAVTHKEYSKPNYPPFVGGGAVLFSPDVVQNVILHFFKSPFKLDDVYVCMLVVNAGVKATHQKEFHIAEKDCKFDVNALALHFSLRKKKNVTTCMMELFREMRSQRNL